MLPCATTPCTFGTGNRYALFAFHRPSGEIAGRPLSESSGQFATRPVLFGSLPLAPASPPLVPLSTGSKQKL
ncbi:hypothetical protein [Asanoa sp. NPDC050611]|uniref:hypothetical protein n=1 Tax=Asanoa sp. NPDC050611 TaxID=3157098 RepID=UPI0033C2BA72